MQNPQNKGQSPTPKEISAMKEEEEEEEENENEEGEEGKLCVNVLDLPYQRSIPVQSFMANKLVTFCWCRNASRSEIFGPLSRSISSVSVEFHIEFHDIKYAHVANTQNVTVSWDVRRVSAP
jgi:hypothetical protein